MKLRSFTMIIMLSILLSTCTIYAQSDYYDMGMTSDTATGCLYGIVSDLITGDPIEGAKVTASIDYEAKYKSKGKPTLKKKYSNFTDEDGFYMLDKLPAGMVDVKVKAENYFEATEEVEIIEDEAIQVDFELNPCINGATGELSGFVLDAITGEPIYGAKVSLKVPFKCMSDEDIDVSGNYQTKTDDEGAYLISEIPIGEFNVIASAKGYESTSGEAIISFGDMTSLDFELFPCEYAYSGSISGMVLDKETRDPISDAKIFVKVVQFTPGCGSPMHKEISGEDGSYSIENLPEGTHKIVVMAKGYMKYIGEVTVITGENTEYDIELDSLWMLPTGTLTGNVFDSKGEPVEGAKIKLLFKKVLGTKAFKRLSPETDEEGYFIIENVPVGEVKVTAKKNKIGTGSASTEIIEDETSDVEIILKKGKSNK
jgi:5-hydroxyisourate hydrolase-like protein (transthyretin family)